jgi:hypothetical protein
MQFPLLSLHLFFIILVRFVSPEYFNTRLALFLVAGDYNPVLDDDDALVERDGLADAWTVLHFEDETPGYTWGLMGRPRFHRSG